jgi:hypothetical protein
MASGIKYVHTNIVARDWKSLAQFYIRAFGCKRKPPERNLKGAWLDEATALKGRHIQGIHLKLPGNGDDEPTLEILQYLKERKGSATINNHGFAHIAFSA